MSEQDFLLRCADCGDPFFTEGEKKFYEARGLTMPKRCKKCRTARKRKFELAQRDKTQAEQELELERLLNHSKYRVSETADIHTAQETTLYVIGNGFDLMHGVKSSYYHFRDTLGRRNALRFALEMYLNVDDLWADFEDALAHINSSAMYATLDMWLDDFNAFDPDAQAADFFLAVDAATDPIYTITEQLPRRFRKWVETLQVSGTDRPLRDLIQNSRVLNFNYTEFIETLYGVDETNICYIHGCRRKKKYHPKEELILGHAPGAGDRDMDADFKLPRYKSARKREMLDAAFDTAARNIGWYDAATTKNCADIIKNHRKFFDGLNDISDIIVIGHSLSEVDWDYFREILRSNQNKDAVHWYLSFHDSNGLRSIERFATAMGIGAAQITIFRT